MSFDREDIEAGVATGGIENVRNVICGARGPSTRMGEMGGRKVCVRISKNKC